MRAFLDWLYRASGALAAIFLLLICGVVLLQVGCNIIDALIKFAGGEPYGLVIPSYAEFAGFFLAASSFLAMAYTLRAGGHIRVMLFLQRCPARLQRAAEYWCAAAGLALSAYFAWYTAKLVADSIEYNDLSPGIIPIPLWIPQSAMALGLIILAVAFLDELVSLARGNPATYAHSDSGPTGRE